MATPGLSKSPSFESSSPASREPSPLRCSADVGILIDGDFPDFDEEKFKRRLANMLHYAVEWRDIDIEPAIGRPETVARVQTGSCEVRVKCVVSGLRSASSSDDEMGDAEVDRIEAFVSQAVRRHWPAGVDVTDIRVRLKRNGSIILVLEMAQPLPVLLMQLAQQRSTKLLEAMPGRLLCCQLGSTVVRLEGCEDRDEEALAKAMEDATAIDDDQLQHQGAKSSAADFVEAEEAAGSAVLASSGKLEPSLDRPPIGRRVEAVRGAGNKHSMYGESTSPEWMRRGLEAATSSSIKDWLRWPHGDVWSDDEQHGQEVEEEEELAQSEHGRGDAHE